MPRDVNGNFTRPTTYVANTKVRANDVNTNELDIAAELTDSLSRSGKGGMLVALKLTDGGTGATTAGGARANLGFGSGVPGSTGLDLLAAPTIFGAQQVIGLKAISKQTIADDSHIALSAASFPGFELGGHLEVFTNTFGAAHARVFLRIGGTLQNVGLLWSNGNVDVKNDGVYTAGNSVDGRFTIGLDPATSSIRFVNRTGSVVNCGFINYRGDI